MKKTQPNPKFKCICDHQECDHKWEDGFYDVRGQYGACEVVGCPCKRYTPH